MVNGGAEEKGKHYKICIHNLLNLYTKTKESNDDVTNVKKRLPFTETKPNKAFSNHAIIHIEKSRRDFTLASMDDFPALDGNPFGMAKKEKLKQNGERGTVKHFPKPAQNLKARKVLNVVNPNAQSQVKNAFGSQKTSLTTINSMANKKRNRPTTNTKSSTPQPMAQLKRRESLLQERIDQGKKTSEAFWNQNCSCKGSDGEKLLTRHAKELVNELTRCQQPSVIQEIHRIVQVVVIFNDKISVKMEELAKALGNIGDEIITPGIIFHFSVLYLKLIMEQGFAPYFTEQMLSGLQKTLKRKCPLLKDLQRVIENELTLRAEKPNQTLPRITQDSERDEFVQWECETNSRHTFNTDRQFDAFIKQRDAFCELFQEWVQESKRGGENDAAFKKKMKVSILELVDKVKQHSNYKPFIRLFLSQLRLGCRKEYSNPVVKNFPPYGPSTQFPHHSFFKEFMESIDSYALQNQMCDTIMVNINLLQHDETYNFSQCYSDSDSDDEDSGDNAPSTLVLADFKDTLCNLRSLGNFLGYLVFDCFKNSADKPGAIKNIEGDRLPSMPLSVCSFALESIKNALQNGHIIPTLTWVVQTLSFIPPNVLWLHTGCLDDCLLYLVKIYTSMAKKNKQSFNNIQLYVISTIGFLFERDILGEETFRHCFDRINRVQDRYTSNRASVDRLATNVSTSNLLPRSHWRLIACESLVTSQLPTSSDGFGVISENVSSRPTLTPRTEKVTNEEVNSYYPSSTVHDFEKSYFLMKTSSTKDSVRFVAEKCAKRCKKHLKGGHIYKRDLDHAVANLIKMKAQEIETDEATAISGVASEIYEEVLPKLKDECEKFIIEYVEKYSREIMEMDNPAYTDDDFSLTKLIARRYTTICMEDCALFKNLFTDIKSRVNRAIRRKQKQQEQGEKLDETPKEVRLTERRNPIQHTNKSDPVFIHEQTVTFPKPYKSHQYNYLKAKATKTQDGEKLDFVDTKKRLKELCSGLLPELYDPTATKLKCPKRDEYRMVGVAFCVREVVIAAKCQRRNLRHHLTLDMRKSLLELGLGDEEVEQIVWFIKMTDQF